MNHSLINASGHTHAKITLLAVTASVVFMAIVSAAGVTRSDAPGALASGPAVKASTMMNVAGSDSSFVR